MQFNVNVIGSCRVDTRHEPITLLIGSPVLPVRVVD